MKALNDSALTHVAEYFRVLAEPLRLKLLNALRDGEQNVGELTALCNCSQANVSKHLTLMAKAGLVERSAQGTAAYYRIADPSIYQLCDLVCDQLGKRFNDQQAKLQAAFAPAKRKSRR